MKKILALILVFGCIFAFASCVNPNANGGNTNENPTDNEGKEQTLEAIQTAVNDSAPINADIEVKFESEIGDLNGSYNVTYNDDGSATVDYSYELFNKYDENAERDSETTTYTGVVAVLADGEVVGNIGGVASVEAVSFDISLDEEYLDDCKIEAGVLEANVKSENSFDVLGVDIPYDSKLTVTTSGGNVTSVVIAYEAEYGFIEIVAVYHY